MKFHCVSGMASSVRVQGNPSETVVSRLSLGGWEHNGYFLAYFLRMSLPVGVDFVCEVVQRRSRGKKLA